MFVRNRQNIDVVDMYVGVTLLLMFVNMYVGVTLPCYTTLFQYMYMIALNHIADRLLINNRHYIDNVMTIILYI